MAQGLFQSVPHSAVLFPFSFCTKCAAAASAKTYKKKPHGLNISCHLSTSSAEKKLRHSQLQWDERVGWRGGGGGHINPFGSISKPLLTVTWFLFVCVICFVCVLAANRQTDATRGQNQNEILRSVGTRACGQILLSRVRFVPVCSLIGFSCLFISDIFRVRAESLQVQQKQLLDLVDLRWFFFFFLHQYNLCLCSKEVKEWCRGEAVYRNPK